MESQVVHRVQVIRGSKFNRFQKFLRTNKGDKDTDYREKKIKDHICCNTCTVFPM